MDPDKVTAISAAANAAVLGQNHAAVYDQKMRKITPVIDIPLTECQLRLVKRYVDFVTVKSPNRFATGDHLPLMALRQIARQVYQKLFQIETTELRTLIVGSGEREMKAYVMNKNIHYHVSGSEGKDMVRIIRKMAESVVKGRKKKARKIDKNELSVMTANIPLKGEVLSRLEGTSPAPKGVDPLRWEKTRRLAGFHNLAMNYAELHDIGPIRTSMKDCVDFTQLCFEDSMYNITKERMLLWFEKTGAITAYGYSFMPYELLFPDLPPHRLYRYHTSGEVASVTFNVSHGYVHDHASWAWPYTHPVVHGPKFDLILEIVATAGPMIVFQIMKKTGPHERIARSIALPDHLAFVKVIDISKSFDIKTKSFLYKKYFSVRAREWFEVLNYLGSLSSKDVTTENAINYMRKRYKGVAMLNSELIAKWDIEAEDIPKAAVAAVCQALLNRMTAEAAVQHYATLDDSWFKRTGKKLISWVSRLLKWLVGAGLNTPLFIAQESVIHQFEKTQYHAWRAPVVSDQVYDENDAGGGYEGPKPFEPDDCEFCMNLPELGKQKIVCGGAVPTTHTFELSMRQLDQLHCSLAASIEKAPSKLRAVLEKAKDEMPKSAFSHTCRVDYIHGGPGTGKSTYIRRACRDGDLVVGPFSCLMEDYLRIPVEPGCEETGPYKNVQFKTQHRALACKAVRIFVDEYTSYPYELLACLAYNSAVEHIFLVGDAKQTAVREGIEGMSIGNHISIPDLRTHTLQVNFRNPIDVVKMLNVRYGYTMEAACQRDKGFEVCTIAEYNKKVRHIPEDKIHKVFAFTKDASSAYANDRDATVRASQGRTYDIVTVFFTEGQLALASNESMQIVALSRHREKVYIVHDDSPNVLALLRAINPQFADHMLDSVSVVEVAEAKHMDVLEHKVEFDNKEPVEAVPPSSLDVGKILVPPIAEYDQNGPASAITVAPINAQLDPDFLNPINSRGHVVPGKREVYAMTKGLGNHFDAINPVQTVASQTRYLGKSDNRQLTVASIEYAENLVQLYFDEHMCSQTVLPDGYMQGENMKALMQAARERNYESRYMAENEIKDVRDVLFYLKDQFKPYENPKPEKVGQGISAWTVEPTTHFIAIFRVLGDLMILMEKDHVLTDHKVKNVDFIRDVKNLLAHSANGSGGGVAKTGYTDMAAFDSCQNRWTQQIEKIFLRKMGVSESVLEHYFRFRSGYILTTPFTKGVAGSQKTSGEVGTLLNNGIVSKVIANAVMRGDGDPIIMYKGDDFVKRQYNLAVDQQVYTKISEYVSLQMKVKIDYMVEYCGFLIAGNTVCFDLRRKVRKVVSHGFRDYDHFAEYQNSIRDWLRDVDCFLDSRDSMILGIAMQCKCDYDQAVNSYDIGIAFLRKFVKLDKRGFHKRFPKVVRGVYVARPTAELPLGIYVEEV